MANGTNEYNTQNAEKHLFTVCSLLINIAFQNKILDKQSHLNIHFHRIFGPNKIRKEILCMVSKESINDRLGCAQRRKFLKELRFLTLVCTTTLSDRNYPIRNPINALHENSTHNDL